ncbi:MAG: carbohydrate-binding family 9-like protein [Elusimicrobiota bacterium]
MKKVIIRKINTELPLDGNLSKPEWKSAEQLSIANYPWYERGGKQKTTVKLLYNNTFLYILFYCEDKHSYSEVTELDGLVCLDSCVEFFANPGGNKYFNLETNCCGTIHLAYGPDRHHRKLAGEKLAVKIKIYKTMKGKTKKESPGDKDWILEMRVPFSMLEELTGVKMNNLSGKIWKANFYRCGGKTNPQYACWSLIKTETPDFHRPEYFGEITFE